MYLFPCTHAHYEYMYIYTGICTCTIHVYVFGLPYDWLPHPPPPHASMPYLYLHLSDELVISKLQGREMYHHSTYVHVHVQSKCACTCACMYKMYSTLEANKTYMYNYTSCCCLTMITLYFSTECWSLIMGLHCFECFHHIWKATACVHSNGMETVTQK